ncbi:hypothetical protein, partial [Methylacidiphilum caldifontis]|uniref:hypothetical protein n=1 Tax=Methylacidiphilum caldifontis TaxID=2795386 RepID=UPI001ABCE05C
MIPAVILISRGFSRLLQGPPAAGDVIPRLTQYIDPPATCRFDACFVIHRAHQAMPGRQSHIGVALHALNGLFQ